MKNNRITDHFENAVKFFLFLFTPEETREGPGNKMENRTLRTRESQCNNRSGMAEKIKSWFWIAVSIGISIGIASLCNS